MVGLVPGLARINLLNIKRPLTPRDLSLGGLINLSFISGNKQLGCVLFAEQVF